MASAIQPGFCKHLSLAGACVLLTTFGCAHHPPSGEQGAAKAVAPNVPVVHVQNQELGVGVDLPASGSFTPVNEATTLARAPDTTEVRIFVQHLAGKATESACWDDLYKHLPHDTPGSPRNAEEFTAVAKAGLDRGDRVVYFSVFPRENHCYVLVMDGPKSSQVLPSAVPVARSTLQIGTPSKPVEADFEAETGVRLLDAKDYEGALQHFNRALQLEPDDYRAHFGAGLAAYFAGPKYAKEAIQHFKFVLTERGEEESPAPGEPRPEQVREALMYTGMAYAELKDYPHAEETLAELVDRYPDDAIGRYNFACVLALSGDADSALSELKEALHREPDLVPHAKEDEDLRTLHSLPAWNELLGQAEKAKPAH